MRDFQVASFSARRKEEQTMVTELHHVNVTVPPQLEQETKKFYRDVLGLEQVPKPSTSRQSGAWYQIGAVQLHLSVETEEQGPLSSRHVCFAVADLREAERRFREAGIEILPDARPIAGISRFYVRDPGGNMLEIVQA
jgi:catechol 2,3-dioxygenase-like lactoylglutathione lyase family enzyme